MEPEFSSRQGSLDAAVNDERVILASTDMEEGPVPEHCCRLLRSICAQESRRIDTFREGHEVGRHDAEISTLECGLADGGSRCQLVQR
ncbi:hypothetical protein EV126DRAFT_425940 [Verticillium dahliae]|nr:hypothetical protein EV126DRAFT_425940 [Verticillium dahliae]